MNVAMVVPCPARIEAGRGRPVALKSPVAIAAPAELTIEARWLGRLLEMATGSGVELVGPGEAALVQLSVAEVRRDQGSVRVPGAYRLDVGGGRIAVTGDSPAGVFYGLQTLRQLLPDHTLRKVPAAPASAQGLAATEPIVVGPIVVEDWPRCAWRGVLVDVARHFFPKGFLLELVDLAAFHKLNVLQLHLTDDQGWRVPIDRYPRLVEVGAWRQESPAGDAHGGRLDGTPHGGYYTKEDLRELVAYAGERHVTVVPEIDMPGHTVAAIAAYPELGNTGRQLEVATRWGVSPHVLNLEEATVDFCTAVVDEVADLFGGRYFHAGGDECPTLEWEASPRARELMADNRYVRTRQLQAWFTGRIAAHLASRGQTLVGWEEIAEDGAPPGAVVVAWRGHGTAAIGIARAGHDVVLAPEHWLYFDRAYTNDAAEPPSARGALPVERVFGFDPVPGPLAGEEARRVLGAQCQLWTEHVATRQRAHYQLFPRLCAFAETVWSPREPGGEPRSYAQFRPRLRRHLDRLATLGVRYRPLSEPTSEQSYD